MVLERLILIVALVGYIAASQVYEVKIHTADESWAGTDAQVYLRLYGTIGVSKKEQLPYQRGYFEKGSTDKFDVDFGMDIGEIVSISIGHDESGFASSWKLQSVEMRKKGSPMYSEFPVNKWLESKDGKTTYVSVDRNTIGSNCGTFAASSSRVVNGEEATKGQWPWQAQINYFGRHHCGGTLIHPNYIVTASHCVDMSYLIRSRMEIVLGQHDQDTNEGTEQRFKVDKIYKHEEWNRRTLDNDIALIKLDSAAMLNNNVKLACLPPQDYQLPGGETCYITGWGRLYGGGPGGRKLQQALLPSVSKTSCSRVMSKVMQVINPKEGAITNNMLCGGGNVKGGCHGDSGGPYVCQQGSRFYLQGAVSWGNSTCEPDGYYTVFARVGNYINWIEEKIQFAKYIDVSEM